MTNKNQFISVAISLRGYELNPDHVSQVLGIQPSRAQKNGEFKPGSTKFIAKIGLWAISSKSNSRSISKVVGELFKKIGNPPTRLDEIEGVEDAYLDVFVPLSHRGKVDKTLEFVLTKRQISKLSQLGLSTFFTIS
jgi:hypothetical protein